ncbi:MAG TPA: IS110 family transposase [Acidimicrobiales bacterium]|nr:IS110 family transposase [Acidimicrobiales bacterium]
MSELRLGIDVACRADHRASLADERGEFLWSSWRFRTTTADLERLWARLPDGREVTVIMEPTRNAWVPLAAWLRARGAKVVLVPPEQSADLRDYFNKHTKTDRLDSRVLARLPMLHPEGLRAIDDLGPGESLRRATRQRASLVKRRTTAGLRLDALVELLGPGWADTLGSGDYTKTSLVLLEKYADPRALKRLGHARLTALVIRTSHGLWREAKATEMLAMAAETLELWAAGGIDFAELAADIASEVRVMRHLDAEIAALDTRIASLYDDADPNGIVRSAPGVGPILAPAILGNVGDLKRFANLAGVRSFTGIVPKVDQSGLAAGHKGITKSGDAGLRYALFLAADNARRVDPTLAARYHRLVVAEGKHHTSAVCSVAAVLITRIAACWRNGQLYELRDIDGSAITESEGRAICTERYKIDAEMRAARRRTTSVKEFKNRAGRGKKESTTTVAPATDPLPAKAIEKVA